MTTYPTTFSLCKPTGDDKIPLETLAYFRERNRNNAYDCVIREFLDSGLTQATVGRRLGKRPEIISRLLGAPGNWTLDTVSDLLLAIRCAEVDYQLSLPFEQAQRNYNGPEWFMVPDQELPRPLRTASTAETTSTGNLVLETVD